MTQQVGRPSEATPSPVLYLPKGPQRAVLVAPDAGWEAAGVAGTSGTSAWQHSSGGVPGPLKLLAHEGCRDRIGQPVLQHLLPSSPNEHAASGAADLLA